MLIKNVNTRIVNLSGSQIKMEVRDYLFREEFVVLNKEGKNGEKREGGSENGAFNRG
jgi:hypothetical protein